MWEQGAGGHKLGASWWKSEKVGKGKNVAVIEWLRTETS